MLPETVETKITRNENVITGLGDIRASLHDRIKLYKKRARDVEDYLLQYPNEWGRFQNEFNLEVNGIFREIMNYDKINLANGQRDKIDKLKRIFINRIRGLFLQSTYFERCLRKPYGYAGDFEIIDDIYQNNPTSLGFMRLIDNYFHMASICIAVRNRKEDFKRIIAQYANDRKSRSIRMMNLGSGPCRDIKELFSLDMFVNKKVTIDCYDNDENALKYAKNILSNNPKVNFFKENALRLAASKNINTVIAKKYDVIYALGIFDYFNHKISVRLISNLKRLLKPGGIMAVSTARDRYSNPSLHCMEWVGEWIILYRTDEEFRKIFTESGFEEIELKVSYEQQGTMQYILATNMGK